MKRQSCRTACDMLRKDIGENISAIFLYVLITSLCSIPPVFVRRRRCCRCPRALCSAKEDNIEHVRILRT